MQKEIASNLKLRLFELKIDPYHTIFQIEICILKIRILLLKNDKTVIYCFVDCLPNKF